MVLGGLLGVVAGVLAVGGAAKLLDPHASSPMLSALGLPARPAAARALGAFEAALGLVPFFVGGPVCAGLVAVVYAGFALAVLRLRAVAGTGVSCGCFGRSSAPPTLVHAVVDGAAALVAGAAAVAAAPGFLEVRPDLPAAGIPQLVVTFVAVGLCVAVLTVLPEALVAARRTPAGERARPVRAFALEGTLR